MNGLRPQTLKVWGWPWANIPMLFWAIHDIARGQSLAGSPNDDMLNYSYYPQTYVAVGVLLILLAVLNRWDGRAQFTAMLAIVSLSFMRAFDVALTFGWGTVHVAATFALLGVLGLWTFIWIPPWRISTCRPWRE